MSARHARAECNRYRWAFADLQRSRGLARRLPPVGFGQHRRPQVVHPYRSRRRRTSPADCEGDAFLAARLVSGRCPDRLRCRPKWRVLPGNLRHGRKWSGRRDRGSRHCDGPDHSPDGRWIWFNSDRGGNMQLWRVIPNGRDPQQMTGDSGANWFPHPSPDGRDVPYSPTRLPPRGTHQVAMSDCGWWSVPPGRSDRLFPSLVARERSTCPAGRRTANDLQSCVLGATTGGQRTGGSTRIKSRFHCRTQQLAAPETAPCAQGFLAILRARPDGGRRNGGVQVSRNAWALATRSAGFATACGRRWPLLASMLDAGSGNR